MRVLPIVTGALLLIFSIPTYYYSPHILSNAVHTFIASTPNGNTMSTTSMLRQMGYPSLHEVIPILQYSIIGLILVDLVL